MSAFTVRCPACGEANSSDDQFCGECGSQLAASVAPPSADAESPPRAALHAARALVAMLDEPRPSDQVNAALVGIAAATDAALSALIDGSQLSGQPLITAARGRGLIDFETTHALLQLHAVCERARETGYLPTALDLEAGRDAYRKLDDALTGGEATVTPVAEHPPLPENATAAVVPVIARKKGMMGALFLVLAFSAISGGIAYAVNAFAHPTGTNVVTTPMAITIPSAITRPPEVTTPLLDRIRSSLPGAATSSDDMAAGVAAYVAGKRREATAAFASAATKHPEMALPHVYLGRIAREDGDTLVAKRELDAAVQLEPKLALAHRERGAYFLSRHAFDEARLEYLDAVSANPRDTIAIGYLGCSLALLGRTDEAQRWFARAGPGPWSKCGANDSPLTRP